MYDVIIESATEADQGLYECQALPSGFRATTYLWVNGMYYQKSSLSTSMHGKFPRLFQCFIQYL